MGFAACSEPIALWAVLAPFLCAAGHSRARGQAAGGDIEVLRAFQERCFASTKGLNFDFAGSDGQRFAE